jgi:nicotinamidase-related amidase
MASNFDKYKILTAQTGLAGAHHPIIHLAIDVQERYTHCLQERRQSYVTQLEKFYEDMRAQNVPTIHVGYDTDHAGQKNVTHIARAAAWSMKAPRARTQNGDILDMKFHIPPRDDEDIIIKYRNSAFAKYPSASPDPGLADLLNQYGTRTVMMTGNSTRACVHQSARRALLSGFKVVLVYDCMADGGPKNRDGNPAWHKQQLEKLFAKEIKRDAQYSGSSVTFMTAQEARAFVAAQNAPLPAKPGIPAGERTRFNLTANPQ